MHCFGLKLAARLHVFVSVRQNCTVESHCAALRSIAGCVSLDGRRDASFQNGSSLKLAVRLLAFASVQFAHIEKKHGTALRSKDDCISADDNRVRQVAVSFRRN